MANPHDRPAAALRWLLLTSARAHGAGIVAFCFATHGYGAIPWGSGPTPFELAAFKLFRPTVALVLHLPNAFALPVVRLSDTFGAHGPLGDWISIFLAVWLDFLGWGIVTAIACGIWRRAGMLGFYRNLLPNEP